MQAELIKEDKTCTLGESIKGLDDFFIKSKRNELYKFVIEMVEKPLIERVLERTDGNQLKAARILGINRNTLRAKIKRLGIDVEKWKF
ncbi:helix-turn-helix domain-containing protein [Candidatus Omnitrophota bacterium]